MPYINRRSFLASAGAFAALGSLRSFGSSGRPALRLGVISDIHVTTPESAGVFARALTYFRDRGVDAVLVPGDLTDWGLVSGLRTVAATWQRVFPGDRAPDGRPVARLFCTGNHDFEGFRYDDMAVEMHAAGYSEDDAIVWQKGGMKAVWEEVFQEPYDEVRLREVNGFPFVSGEWAGRRKVPAWLAANRGRIDPSRPFFYFQHPPVENTTVHSTETAYRDGVRGALDAFPNAIAFTGHTHWTFHDERSIWQGAFTAVSTPSMSYSTVPRGYENGSSERDGSSRLSMPKIPTRLNLTEAQGYFISVNPDSLEIERHDFTRMCTAAAPWIVPLPPARERPYAPETARARAGTPQFPAGAELRLRTRNTEDRQGKWAIVQQFIFPTAVTADGARAFDYEVRAVPTDGSAAVVKRFLEPAFDQPATVRAKEQLFWFNAAELPQDREYRFEVYPRNCFGASGRPLVSAPRRGKPGLANVKRRGSGEA